jgi:Mn-dependent DtxR family transcriptional regulator
MQNSLLARLLVTMLDQAQLSRPPGRTRLAALLGWDLSEIDRALSDLDRQGLVDAARVRLTFPGLTVASSARAAIASRTLAA